MNVISVVQGYIDKVVSDPHVKGMKALILDPDTVSKLRAFYQLSAAAHRNASFVRNPLSVWFTPSHRFLRKKVRNIGMVMNAIDSHASFLVYLVEDLGTDHERMTHLKVPNKHSTFCFLTR